MADVQIARGTVLGSGEKMFKSSACSFLEQRGFVEKRIMIQER
jgi:hypothetical protein